jgi:hypothetical protein
MALPGKQLLHFASNQVRHLKYQEYSGTSWSLLDLMLSGFLVEASLSSLTNLLFAW